MKRKKNHQALTFRLFLASLPHLFNCAPGGSALPVETDNRQPTRPLLEVHTALTFPVI
jgi:hypothetical protein